MTTEFALTLLRVERVRATLMAGFFAGVSVLLALRLVLAFGAESSSSISPGVIGARLAVTVTLLSGQLLVRHLIAQRQAEATPLSESAWHLLAVIEILGLGVIVSLMQSVAPYPATFGVEAGTIVLLLFVGLSALRLRIGLSVLTGVLAGAIFLVLAHRSPLTSELGGGLPEGYYWTAGLVVGSGGVVGVLARQLRHQVIRLIHSLAERQTLEREAAQAAEAERHRIGRDLHDDLGARLTGIAMLCRGLVQRSRKGRAIDPARLEDVAVEVEASVEQARRLAHGLSPLDLTEGYLTHALRILAERTEASTGITTLLHTSGPLDALLGALPTDALEHLYRIAQEAVTNAVRHAAPDEIRLTLAPLDQGFRFTVEDDGTGLSQSNQGHTEGLGIHTMQRRARLIGASFSMVALPGKGTRVACDVPVTEKAGQTLRALSDQVTRLRRAQPALPDSPGSLA